MIKEVWRSFPHVLEQKINSLLDEADPNPMKAFHLYKTCLRENLCEGSFENFSDKLTEFFHTPRAERSKSTLDRLLLRPAHASVFADFHLNFKTAKVPFESVRGLAGWASQIIRISKKTESPISSKEVLIDTLQKVTSPGPGDKEERVEFEDFCTAWKKVVFYTYGTHHIQELHELQKELRWLKAESEQEKIEVHAECFIPTIYLTQTEIDWVQSIEKALTFDKPLPPFPLSKGPQKQRLIDLERTIKLYRIVQTTRLEELLLHKENIRNTIFDRCKRLLKERSR